MLGQKQLLSLADLLEMEARVEIIDGELVPMVAAGGVHQLIGRNIFRLLDDYVMRMAIGEVLYDGLTYLMNSPFSGLKDSFVPDVSFISNDNVPLHWHIEKPHPGAPDLAVEIISPNDNAEDVQRKVRTYLAQGTQEVWLVYPATQEVQQYTSAEANKATIYTQAESHIVTSLFPDLDSLSLKAIFHLPKWALKTDTKNSPEG